MLEGAHTLLRKDPEFKKLYKRYKKNSFKIKTDVDPRVTRVGRFLRRTSLDELPQLINILKGEMSLVGPRAFHTDELAQQQRRFPQTKKLIKTLLAVKPGLTGPWQVSGRSSVDFPERVKLDATYARQKSLLADFKIILKTIPAVIRGEGN
jgi:lipopolysaccharide/colanic/teichoic acid biosynthesis glycosyltransferase